MFKKIKGPFTISQNSKSELLDFCKLIAESVPVWREEFIEVTDKRVLWDLIKYRIRQVTIKYSKAKAKARRQNFESNRRLIKAVRGGLQCVSIP